MFIKRKYIIYLIIFFIVFLVLWAFWFEPASLSKQKIEIGIKYWPKECNGLKIVLLADLHIGSPFNGLNKLPRIIEETNKLEPDLILLAGDFVIHGVVGGNFVEPELIAKELAKLKPLNKVFAVLGNHDWWYDAERVSRSLIEVGIPLLENASQKLSIGDCDFLLVGISDYWEGKHDVSKALSKVEKDVPTIVFTHNPDIFDEIPNKVSIIFAGHTHGGQVSLPILGRPIVPSEYGERFAIGHIHEGDKQMFVNPGIGTSILPVRFRVPPEISLVILKSNENLLH